MKGNIHNIERGIRIAVGAGLVGAFFFFDPSNFWYLIGVVPLLTGLVGWCPPYALFGFSTKPAACGGGGCGGDCARNKAA